MSVRRWWSSWWANAEWYTVSEGSGLRPLTAAGSAGTVHDVQSMWHAHHVRHLFIYIHTYIHPFNGPFPGLPWWAGTRKVKPIWILLKQETVSGNGISWAICKSPPHSRQITTPAPHHSVFYRPDALPAAQPTASKHWRQFLHAKLSYGCLLAHCAGLAIIWVGTIHFQTRLRARWLQCLLCCFISSSSSLVNSAF